MLNKSLTMFYMAYVSVLLYSTVTINGGGLLEIVSAKRHDNVRDFDSWENWIWNNETGEKKARQWTLDHARMGMMDRYLDPDDAWVNNTKLPPIETYRNTWDL